MTSISAPPTSPSIIPTSSRTTAARTRSISRSGAARSTPRTHGRHSCTTAHSSTGYSAPIPSRSTSTANDGGKTMTTHDMQPETADQTLRADRPGEPQRTEPPMESADTTGDFANPMQTREAPDPGHASVESHAAPVDTAESSDQML